MSLTSIFERSQFAPILLLTVTIASIAPIVQAQNTTVVDVSIGPRPFYLTDKLPEGELKSALESCNTQTIKPSLFSIGHRGAPMQFPEHTRESYMAAARMGAGIVECDVTFTKDKELVCRHSQCDLHTTTNILATPLAENCTAPPDYNADTPFANVQCCTSDITVAEFKTLKGKMDAGNPAAKTLEEYLQSTAAWRTDLYSQPGTLLTHAESIRLFDQLGVGMTPELKKAMVTLPFDGDYTRNEQADQLLQEYRDANIDPSRVWPQSFEEMDIAHWLSTAPDFAAQVVYLDGRYRDPGFDPMIPNSWSPSMNELKESGVQYLAPPLWMLVTLNDKNNMMPSSYAKSATDAGLKLLAWSLERSGPLDSGNGGWYYKSVAQAIDDDSDMLQLLEVLAKDVGVTGVFSDWPATTSYYAHCRM
jgi:glycerophosphoryl diester phosphodiesterase